MPKPISLLPDLAYLTSHQEACETFDNLCRRHPLVKMVENAIREGDLPIDGFRDGVDRLRAYRGSGFFTFKELRKHCAPDTIYMTAEVSVYDGDEGVTREVSLYLHIPSSFLDVAVAKAEFSAYCQKRRQDRADRLAKDAKEAEAAAIAAQKAVVTPVKPELAYSLG